MKENWPAVAVVLVFLASPAEALESIDDLNPLYQALPTRLIEVVGGWEQVRTPEFPLSRTKGMFAGRSDKNGLVGVVVHLVAEGWGGPIGMLVSFDPSGTLLRVSMLRHEETQCHVPGSSVESMLSRIVGIELAQKIRLLVGLKSGEPGDVEAISGGTVSSRAIIEAIAEARIAFHQVRSSGLLEKP